MAAIQHSGDAFDHPGPAFNARWQRADLSSVGVGERPPEKSRRAYRNGNQIGVGSCDAPVRHGHVVFEADTDVTAKACRNRRARRLLRPERAHRPRLAAQPAVRHEGHEIGGRGIRRRLVAAKHEQPERMALGHHAARHEIIEAAHVIGVVENVLRRHRFTPAPCEKSRRARLMLGGRD